jgi:formate-dependent nitrite reductase membrane component NrfD
MKEMAYYWMVDYTSQKEWIEGSGKALWLAFLFSEIGAGLYFVSLFVNNGHGYVLGWLTTIVLGGGFHLAYLGNPQRAWRAFLQPRKSEISRGMIIIALYAVAGALHLAPLLSVFAWLPWSAHSMFFKLLIGVLSFLVIIHGFLTMSVLSAIPFWNTATLTLFSVSSGIWIGTQFTIGTSLFFGDSLFLQFLEMWSRWALLGYIVIGGAFLWNAACGNPTMRYSLRILLWGQSSLVFYSGAVGIGLIVPVLITLWGLSSPLSHGLLWLRLISAFLGDAAIRYSVLKAGVYTPLVAK